MSFRLLAGYRRFLGASSALTSWGAAALIAGTPTVAWAQAATELPPVAVDTIKADSTPLGASPVDGDQLKQRSLSTGDAASLVDGVPGVNLLTNGGVSSLPTIHGLGDDRVLQLLDGVATTSACPNHMNPPLSYAQPQAVGKVNVFPGISPVSQGGDNIGGVVAIESKSPVFANPGEGLRTGGQFSTYYKSNASNVGSSVEGTMAGENLSLGVTGGWSRAADYRSGDGTVMKSTSYEHENYAVTAAAQKDGQTFILRGGQQFLPYENFPNAAMDMVGNRQAFLNANYKGEFGWGKIDALGYWNKVSHRMDTTATDRHGEGYGTGMMAAGMPMPMLTEGTDTGYSLKAELPLSKADTLRVGNELHMQTLNDWWPATTTTSGTMGPNTFININHGIRDRFGTYAEWESNRWNPAWTTLLGVRNELVWSDTGNVSGYKHHHHELCHRLLCFQRCGALEAGRQLRPDGD
jgi:iron complex outermembrane recepter protein